PSLARAAALPTGGLTFVANAGQEDPAVAYYGRGAGSSVAFERRQVVLGLERNGRGVAIAMRFVGASPKTQITARHASAARVNYLVGTPDEWRTGLRTYRQVVYRNLWSNVDVQFRDVGGTLKYTFVVRPGADPRTVRF